MKLYNTLHRKKETFKPIEPGKVKIYACGPTVYNFFHLGNARPFIVFDTLRRYFEYCGYTVDFVQNFTDIDDKMIKRANEEGISVGELAERFIHEYFIDSKGLNIKQATCHPRATENISAIIELVQTLIEKGYAYESHGDVYFSTKKYAQYGKLSAQPLEDLELGARIEVDSRKQDPMDFALWKAQKPGEPAWESPWGLGRPGWHIECSAMANKILGKTIDIHAGGKDLIFPHHENEIAQSEAANGVPFANYWIHNGYINVNNEKMSKSLGNFFTVRDIAEKYDYEVMRFFMLSAHYRNPVNFSDDLLLQAKTALERLYNCMSTLEFTIVGAEERRDNVIDEDFLLEVQRYKKQFIDAMDDDMNTAGAIGALFELAKCVNITCSVSEKPSAHSLSYALVTIHELGDILGILNNSAQDDLDTEIENLIVKRTEARKNKDFKTADEIRQQLSDMGIILDDTKDGVKWKRK